MNIKVNNGKASHSTEWMQICVYQKLYYKTALNLLYHVFFRMAPCAQSLNPFPFYVSAWITADHFPVVADYSPQSIIFVYIIFIEPRTGPGDGEGNGWQRTTFHATIFQKNNRIFMALCHTHGVVLTIFTQHIATVVFCYCKLPTDFVHIFLDNCTGSDSIMWNMGQIYHNRL